MLIPQKKQILLKFLSLFSVVRGYNILIIVVAQYLTSIFIMAKGTTAGAVLLDPNLLVIVLSSAMVIASGYIINNFYDMEKDLINRPHKTLLEGMVGQRTRRAAYFTLNILSVVMASYVSFRAVLFFSAYIFGIWWYSHTLKKMVLVGNLVAAVLAITPFFAIFVYYKNFDTVIFIHAVFLFLLILIRELVKDLENMKGDFTQNYKTIPVLYGEKTAKKTISFLVGLTCITAGVLIAKFRLGYMYYYFYQSLILLVCFVFLLWRFDRKNQYVWLHNILKFIIVSGVFGIVLIDIDLILKIL